MLVAEPKVSVIINCFNGERFLSEALGSVLSQTFHDWELIFWDNCSTDNSAGIVSKFLVDERVRYYLASKHTSLGEARNLAVEKASGEWIAFLDCDDVWFANKLEVQVKLIDSSLPPVDLVYSDIALSIESSSDSTALGKSAKSKESISPLLFRSRKGGIAFIWLLFECYIPLPSALVRKSVFREVGGINPKLQVAEDYELFLKVLKTGVISYVSEVLGSYRVHDNNLSHEDYRRTFHESIDIVREVLNDKPIIRAITLSVWKGRFLITALRISDKLTSLSLLKRADYIVGALFYVAIFFPSRVMLKLWKKYFYDLL